MPTRIELEGFLNGPLNQQVEVVITALQNLKQAEKVEDEARRVMGDAQSTVWGEREILAAAIKDYNQARLNTVRQRLAEKGQACCTICGKVEELALFSFVEITEQYWHPVGWCDGTAQGKFDKIVNQRVLCQDCLAKEQERAGNSKPPSDNDAYYFVQTQGMPPIERALSMVPYWHLEPLSARWNLPPFLDLVGEVIIPMIYNPTKAGYTPCVY